MAAAAGSEVMMVVGLRFFAAGLSLVLGAALAAALPASAAETPKRGGTLTYLIPADAPPTFDGHRETTYATVHSVAPFYSVLIRINPDNPGSTTDFVCEERRGDAALAAAAEAERMRGRGHF